MWLAPANSGVGEIGVCGAGEQDSECLGEQICVPGSADLSGDLVGAHCADG